MRRNYCTGIVGEKCVLIPYRRLCVEKYHEWMKDPLMLEATGSEPLSLDEEYEMQKSWRLDENKCTFIVLAKEKCNMTVTEQEGSNFVEKHLDAMVGDVNLFLSELETENDDENATESTEAGADIHSLPRIQAELDIMVAEKWAQGQGMGKEASALMIQYATTELNVVRFFVKINESNTASRNLFAGRLGFTQCDYAECFHQYEYELWRNKNDKDDDIVTNVLGGRTLTCFHCSADDELD